ncbi:MAG: hypothetical protein ACREBS_08045 [Nitrososphaerales archaeon]
MQEEYAISCDDEHGLVLSNYHALDIWEALGDLIEILRKQSNFSSQEMLFSWKEKPRHHAQAREPYAWRAAMEEIKNSDLPAKCADVKDRFAATLMSDKPVMLKIAGEITSCLMHSYSSRHRLSFSQRVSKVPS